MNLKRLLILLSFLLPLSLYAQGEFEYTETSDDDSYFLDYLNQSSTDGKNPVYKPIIGLGRGIITYMGDVRDYSNNIYIGRGATKLIVSRNINSFLRVDYTAMQGTISGNEKGNERNLNFESDIVSGAISVAYNFDHLFEERDAILESSVSRTKWRPYISLGFEAFEFNSKGDLKDANGNTYYNWSDGTLRNIPEDPQKTDESIILHRDYVYETDLRDMDIDGSGRYPEIAFAIPIDAGLDIQVMKRLSMRMGASYHYVFHDKIDNISGEGEGLRNGDKGQDNYLLTYVSFHLDLFKKPDIPLYYQHIDFLDISMFEFEDEDGDKIHDLMDECAYTEPGIKVGVDGCPLDTDGDGIGEQIDEELQTQAGAIVDLKGVTMTEDVVGDTIAIPHSEICEWYPSLCRDNRNMFKSFYVEIPDEFKKFDSDDDGYISYEEYNDVIDAWFDFKVELTIDDIYKLNDFFFEQ